MCLITYVKSATASIPEILEDDSIIYQSQVMVEDDDVVPIPGSQVRSDSPGPRVPIQNPNS